ncbi:unnamed protein product [Vitrella brassicaformis CCMP3155]|uniref:Uncharacterized protein n=7 Tax=Vitrella brassicaformis TaxID=1169539 RepID=A0A0G4EAS3_VITBC|nr:unnamed protein product [Vitrella brassicaformis CCMP3155]|eukprot:CEL92546.1 unnamed protein product [Vitrella brassicaformis CCMP3155]
MHPSSVKDLSTPLLPGGAGDGPPQRDGASRRSTTESSIPAGYVSVPTATRHQLPAPAVSVPVALTTTPETHREEEDGLTEEHIHDLTVPRNNSGSGCCGCLQSWRVADRWRTTVDLLGCSALLLMLTFAIGVVVMVPHTHTPAGATEGDAAAGSEGGAYDAAMRDWLGETGAWVVRAAVLVLAFFLGAIYGKKLLYKTRCYMFLEEPDRYFSAPPAHLPRHPLGAFVSRLQDGSRRHDRAVDFALSCCMGWLALGIACIVVQSFMTVRTGSPQPAPVHVSSPRAAGQQQPSPYPAADLAKLMAVAAPSALDDGEGSAVPNKMAPPVFGTVDGFFVSAFVAWVGVGVVGVFTLYSCHMLRVLALPLYLTEAAMGVSRDRSVLYGFVALVGLTWGVALLILGVHVDWDGNLPYPHSRWSSKETPALAVTLVLSAALLPAAGLCVWVAASLWSICFIRESYRMLGWDFLLGKRTPVVERFVGFGGAWCCLLTPVLAFGGVLTLAVPQLWDYRPGDPRLLYLFLPGGTLMRLLVFISAFCARVAPILVFALSPSQSMELLLNSHLYATLARLDFVEFNRRAALHTQPVETALSPPTAKQFAGTMGVFFTLMFYAILLLGGQACPDLPLQPKLIVGGGGGVTLTLGGLALLLQFVEFPLYLVCWATHHMTPLNRDVAREMRDRSWLGMVEVRDIVAWELWLLRNLYHLANYPAVKQNLLETLEANPRNHRALLYLGLLSLREGRYDEAYNDLHKAVDVRPDFPDALMELAITVRMTHGPYEALPYMQRAASLAGWRPSICLNYGVLCQAKSPPDPHAAIKWFRKGLKAKKWGLPKSLETMLTANLIEALMTVRHYREAMNAGYTGLKVDKTNARIRVCYARACLCVRENSRAEKLLESLVSSEPPLALGGWWGALDVLNTEQAEREHCKVLLLASSLMRDPKFQRKFVATKKVHQMEDRAIEALKAYVNRHPLPDSATTASGQQQLTAPPTLAAPSAVSEESSRAPPASEPPSSMGSSGVPPSLPQLGPHLTPPSLDSPSHYRSPPVSSGSSGREQPPADDSGVLAGLRRTLRGGRGRGRGTDAGRRDQGDSERVGLTNEDESELDPLSLGRPSCIPAGLSITVGSDMQALPNGNGNGEAAKAILQHDVSHMMAVGEEQRPPETSGDEREVKHKDTPPLGGDTYFLYPSLEMTLWLGRMLLDRGQELEALDYLLKVAKHDITFCCVTYDIAKAYWRLNITKGWDKDKKKKDKKQARQPTPGGGAQRDGGVGTAVATGKEACLIIDPLSDDTSALFWIMKFLQDDSHSRAIWERNSVRKGEAWPGPDVWKEDGEELSLLNLREARYNACRLLRELGQPDKALPWASEAFEFDKSVRKSLQPLWQSIKEGRPSPGYLQFEVGRCYAALENWPLAINMMDQAKDHIKEEDRGVLCSELAWAMYCGGMSDEYWDPEFETAILLNGYQKDLCVSRWLRCRIDALGGVDMLDHAWLHHELPKLITGMAQGSRISALHDHRLLPHAPALSLLLGQMLVAMALRDIESKSRSETSVDLAASVEASLKELPAPQLRQVCLALQVVIFHGPKHQQHPQATASSPPPVPPTQTGVSVGESSGSGGGGGGRVAQTMQAQAAAVEDGSPAWAIHMFDLISRTFSPFVLTSLQDLPDVEYQLTTCLWKVKNYDRALQVIKEAATSRHKTHRRMLRMAAQGHFSLMQFSASLEYYERILELLPPRSQPSSEHTSPREDSRQRARLLQEYELRTEYARALIEVGRPDDAVDVLVIVQQLAEQTASLNHIAHARELLAKARKLRQQSADKSASAAAVSQALINGG